MFSRVQNAMKLSFLFYDHSNSLKLLWELQIDVSIIYSFEKEGGVGGFPPTKKQGDQRGMQFPFFGGQ